MHLCNLLKTIIICIDFVHRSGHKIRNNFENEGGRRVGVLKHFIGTDFSRLYDCVKCRIMEGSKVAKFLIR